MDHVENICFSVGVLLPVQMGQFLVLRDCLTHCGMFSIPDPGTQRKGSSSTPCPTSSYCKQELPATFLNAP